LAKKGCSRPAPWVAAARARFWDGLAEVWTVGLTSWWSRFRGRVWSDEWLPPRFDFVFVDFDFVRRVFCFGETANRRWVTLPHKLWKGSPSSWTLGRSCFRKGLRMRKKKKPSAAERGARSGRKGWDFSLSDVWGGSGASMKARGEGGLRPPLPESTEPRCGPGRKKVSMARSRIFPPSRRNLNRLARSPSGDYAIRKGRRPDASMQPSHFVGCTTPPVSEASCGNSSGGSGRRSCPVIGHPATNRGVPAGFEQAFSGTAFRPLRGAVNVAGVRAVSTMKTTSARPVWLMASPGASFATAVRRVGPCWLRWPFRFVKSLALIAWRTTIFNCFACGRGGVDVGTRDKQGGGPRFLEPRVWRVAGGGWSSCRSPCNPGHQDDRRGLRGEL